MSGRIVKGNPVFCVCPVGTVGPGRASASAPLRAEREKERSAEASQIMMTIGNENDQVKEGHLVDALACTGDEGRDTLR